MFRKKWEGQKMEVNAMNEKVTGFHYCPTVLMANGNKVLKFQDLRTKWFLSI
jgi:hypothetical protein